MKHLRTTAANLLIVDGGNALAASASQAPEPPQVRQAVEKAKVIIAAYNAMGYQALAIGDSELGLGVANLKELQKLMKFPLLCANLVEAEGGKPVFAPSAIVDAGTVKVGLIGTIMNTLNARFLERVAPGTKLADGVEAARKLAAELRPRVDLVVGLCHANDDENRKLLAASPDIDAIVDPCSFYGNHTLWIPEEQYLTWVEGRPVLRCDAQGSRFGRFDMLFGAEGKPFVSWAAFQEAYEKQGKGVALSAPERDLLAAGARRHLGGMEVIPIFPHFAEAPEIKALVAQFKASTRFAEVNADEEQRRAKERYATAESCKGCHEENYRAWRASRHGAAYKTLEKTGDEFRYDCLPCHTLGYGETFVDAHKVGPYKDVQCESCHGTNPAHKDDPEKHRWPAVAEMNCLVCHNPEHLGEPFDFTAKVHTEPCCTVP